MMYSPSFTNDGQEEAYEERFHEIIRYALDRSEHSVLGDAITHSFTVDVSRGLRNNARLTSPT